MASCKFNISKGYTAVSMHSSVGFLLYKQGQAERIGIVQPGEGSEGSVWDLTNIYGKV